MASCEMTLGVPCRAHGTNDGIRLDLDVRGNWLLNFVNRQNTAYFGHVKRHHGSARTILERLVLGNGRRSDRPREGQVKTTKN